MWITYLIPRIEDGNNFGVSIQVSCISDVKCCLALYLVELTYTSIELTELICQKFKT